MLQWIKDLYAEFTPRSIKVLITAVAVVGFTVYLWASTSTVDAALVVPKKSNEDTALVNKAKIFVHVTGKVKHPGIYQLDSGSRVFDAVLLAGGFTAKANQSGVNLARLINDGEQIIIGTGNSPVGSAESLSFISLNQSASSTLEDLPGVGPALAGRIVDWREANGGFKSKEDLLNVAGIGDKLFASIKDLVTL